MSGTYTLTLSGTDAAKGPRQVFAIRPKDAASRALAVAALERAGWTAPGAYTNDLEFEASTTSGAKAAMASRELQAAGFKLVKVNQKKWDNRPRCT